MSPEKSKLLRQACVATAGVLLISTIAALAVYRSTYVNQGNLHGKIVGVENVHSDQPKMLGMLPSWLGRADRTDTTMEVVVPMRWEGASLFGMFVALNVVAVPKHFFVSNAQSPTQYKILPGQDLYVGNFPLKFNPACLYYYEERDLSLYFVGNVNGAWKSVYNNLPLAVEPCVGQAADMKNVPVKIEMFQKGELYYKPMMTVPGDCGRPLVVGDVVVGMHVAATNAREEQFRYSVAVSLSQDLIGRGFKFFVDNGRIPVQLDDRKPQGYPTLTDENLVNTDMNWCLKTATSDEFYFADMHPLGCIRQRDIPRMTCTETTMHHVFSDRCGKYMKARTGRAVPMEQPDGTKKYVSPVTRRFDIKIGNKAFDGALMDFVVEEAISELPTPTKPLVPMTWYDALVGHPDNFLINPKDYSTSVGPLNSLQGRKASMAFTPLEEGEGFIIAPWFIARMEELETMVAGGKIPVTLSRATLKDEPQTLKKFDIFKTRLFYVPEAEFNLLVKKYIKPLMVHCMVNNHITGFKIVINPAGRDWDILAAQLLKFGHGKGLFDADQSNFDLHHGPVFQWVMYYVQLLAIKCGYNPLARFMVGVLMEACIRSVLMLENVFYLVCTRLLSGLDVTSFFNGIINTLLNRMCTRLAMRKLLMPDTARVRDYMFDSTNGDDLVMSIHEKLRIVLNGTFLVECCASVGYDMTDGAKGDEAPYWKDITEVVFVKRKFRLEDGRYKCPLALESIYKALSYACRSTVSREERDRGALLCAYKEIWMHGREMFDEFRTLCSVNGLLVKEYDSYQSDFDNECFFPWVVETKIETQGSLKEGTIVLRDELSLFDQLLLEHASGPRIERMNQGSSPPDSSSKRGAGWFSSSTELNNINPSLPKEEYSPVNKIAVGDEDSMVAYSPGFLTGEVKEESLAQFFARPRRVLSFDITTAAVGAANVALFTTWAALPGVAKIVSQYRFWRGKPTFKIVYSGNPSVLGYVRVVAVPTIEADNYTAELQTVVNPNTAVSFTRSSTMPHIDMDLSKPCCCEMTLPFPSQFDYRLVSVADWTLFFFELGPMASADTAITPAPITFEVYCHYTDLQFLALVPQAGETGGPWENFLSYSAYVLSWIPHPYATVASAIASGGAKVAHFLGLSRPMLEATDAIVARKHGNTALASGQCDMVMHAGLDPGVGSNILWSQFPLGMKDDMEVSRMTKTFSHLKTAWLAGSANSIMCDPTNLFTLYPAGQVIYPTSLAFASFLFNFWRGSLVYRIKFFSSPLIRWRVAIVVVPEGIVSPAAYSGSADYITTIVDVVGSTEVDVVVPYLKKTPWSTCSRQLGISLNNGSRIMFFQLAAPSGPGTTTSLPLVDVWVKGGDDFELAQPTLDYVNLFRTSQSGKSSRAAYNFGEIVDNWRLLIKRPVVDLIGATTPSRGEPGRMSLPMDGVGPIDATVVGVATNQIDVFSSGWTWDTYLRRAFIGYNGGTIHRFTWDDAELAPTRAITRTTHVFQRNEPFGSNPHPGPAAVMEQGFGTGDIIFTVDDFMIETGFPSRANANFKNPQKQDLLYVTSQECVSVFCPEVEAAAESLGFTHIMSALDDRTYGGLIMIPALVVRPL